MKRSQSIAKYSVVFILYESVPKQLQALFFFQLRRQDFRTSHDCEQPAPTTMGVGCSNIA